MAEQFDVLAVLDAGCAGLLRQFGQKAVYEKNGIGRDTMALVRPTADRATPFGVAYTEAGRVPQKRYLAYMLPIAGVAAADMEDASLTVGGVRYDIFDAVAHQLSERQLYLSLILTRAVGQGG